jgi:hypothetical protein
MLAPVASLGRKDLRMIHATALAIFVYVCALAAACVALLALAALPAMPS